jgi:hypothetical protein
LSGATLTTDPFQVNVKAPVSEGHDWRKGPPPVDDVAHAVPAGGFGPFNAR